MLLKYRLLNSSLLRHPPFSSSSSSSSFKLTSLLYRSFSTDSSSNSSHSHNSLNPELYTVIAFLSITRLPQYADKYKTQYIEASHILKSILEEGPTGIAQRAITKAGVNPIKFTE